MIASHIDDPNSPEYTLIFPPKAEELASEAEDALLRGDRTLATEYYLRACAILRTARYSTTNDKSCAIKEQAWQLQKYLYQKAGRLWENPLDQAIIPHVYDTRTHPDLQLQLTGHKAVELHRPRIPTYVRLPTDTLCTGRPCPAVLIVGDDRTAHTRQCEEALSRGWGCVVVEVPGTGDCPVSRAQGEEEEEEEAADEVWSSVLDWMRAIRVFDMGRIVAWGPGEPVVRLAATHGDRLRGCVAQLGRAGGGRDLSMLDEISCRLLLVTDGCGDSAVNSNGLWTPGAEGRGEGRLALFEYGVPGTSVVQHPVADTRTVYNWVSDVMSVEEL